VSLAPEKRCKSVWSIGKDWTEFERQCTSLEVDLVLPGRAEPIRAPVVSASRLRLLCIWGIGRGVPEINDPVEPA
jgi:hypothetical protein